MRQVRYRGVIRDASSEPLSRSDKAVVVGFVVLAVSLVGGVLAAFGGMFQYVLRSFFGKDLPFFLDVFFGLALNGVTPSLYVLCVVARSFGYEPPFIH